MKKQYLLTLFVTLVVIGFSFGGVMAQDAASIADVCGQTKDSPKCGAEHFGTIVKDVFALVITLGLPLLFVFTVWRFILAWFALQQGNTNAYKEAIQRAGNAVLGFIIIVALFGGVMYTVLAYFGVRTDAEFNPLKVLQIFSDAFIPHAYAQERYLPNPTGINSIYDFILAGLRLIMRFFVFPALIVIWVWTGFSFVAAQGNPDGLRKAKNWLMWAFITTLVIFLLQAFLVSLRGTVQKIFPGGASSVTTGSKNANSPGTTDSKNTNSSGATGSQPSSSGGKEATGADFCTGKRAGTLCSVTVSGGTKTGTCTSNDEGTLGCYVVQPGDSCITAGDAYGQIASDGKSCLPGGVR